MTKFFTALNPCSKDAGLQMKGKVPGKMYAEVFDVEDLTFYELIQDKADYFLKVRRGLGLDYVVNIFHMVGLIGGAHHPLFDGAIRNYVVNHADKESDIETGSKGLFDFLIFPLLARKLMADTYLESRKDAHVLNVLAWMVAIPLEIIRDTAVISLTLLLALTVIPLATIIQQFVSPSEKDLPSDAKADLKKTQIDLTDILAQAWTQRGDADAAQHIRQNAPG
ncbi:MAG: hypothetical protein K0U37_08825 [Gammaproteobacteria bacterium]|nr:hypothetical protein [Gammaproteobacteria bacterium]